MRGNYGLLIVFLGAILSLAGTCLGGQLYRWEMITWESVAAVAGLLGYSYSRCPESE